MPTVGTTSKPAYVYDAGTDTWVPVGVGAHTHDTSALVPYSNYFVAGKNKIINGDFGIWQRGTTFNSVNGLYTADRWIGATNKTVIVSREAFAPGSAPVAGYEGTYFLRSTQSASGSYYAIQQRIEDVRTLAGQTVTLSFWAKADATVSNRSYLGQIFGSGGSSNVDNYSSPFNITTSWARYTQTVTLPSMSGKTIGSNSYLNIQPILQEDSAAHIVDIWGVQVEAGSVATPFSTATGTLAGELAACQRYYERIGNVGLATHQYCNTSCYSSTLFLGVIPYKVQKRVQPSLSSTAYTTFGHDGVGLLGIGFQDQDTQTLLVRLDVSGATPGFASRLYGAGATTNYIEVNSEL
jgi:hypothetical protein